jgi:shikimate kinase
MFAATLQETACHRGLNRLSQTRVSTARQLHNLALIGFMGTGKSSVGQLVAGQLHFTFLDTDHLVETLAGKVVSDIFAQDGEPVFRDWERRIVGELALRTKTVIATGGGLPADEANLDSLKTHAVVVCLWASPETIWQRVRGQTHRPLLNDPDPLLKIRRLLEVRKPYYRQADVLINTEMRSLKEVAQQVIHQFLAARTAGQ